MIFMLSCLGGILGVLFMIPMRRYLIVQEHGKLPFPEGTACAEILKSGSKAGPQALLAMIGIAGGFVHKILSSAFFVFKESPSWIITSFQRTMFSIDCTPALLGVGFIIGPRITSYLFAGGVLAWWVIIPMISLFGGGSAAVIFPSINPIDQMSAADIWSKYIRYIGAGAVATGGLLSLIKISPLIFKTLRLGFGDLFQIKTHPLRTDRDISMKWLVIGSVFVVMFLWLFPGMPMNFLTIVLLVILGFFFVAVTSLTVGIVGSTSNPASGMTITTLLITCLIFVALGWTERIYLIAALTMSIVANVAICMAGTTSQDLKTGFLLGGTPRAMQIAEIIGIFLPAIAIAGTLLLLEKTYKFGTAEMPAPQGTMMALVAQGVLNGDIQTTLVMVGVILALMMELLKIPILPFALGVYLPLSLTSGMMVGGIVSYFVTKYQKSADATDHGILVASGLVAGDACTGVLIAGLAIWGIVPTEAAAWLPDFFSVAVYAALAGGLAWLAMRPTEKWAKKL